MGRVDYQDDWPRAVGWGLRSERDPLESVMNVVMVGKGLQTTHVLHDAQGLVIVGVDAGEHVSGILPLAFECCFPAEE